MPEYAPLEIPQNPQLAGNILHFARALRKAGLPVGTGHALDAIRAVAVAGFSNRSDFYWTLHACFVSRPEHRTVFEQIFRLYWRDPRFLEQMMSMLLPSVRGVQEERAAKPAEKRAAQALLEGTEPPAPETPKRPEETTLELDASRTMSAQEKLRQLDFEQMSTEEIAAAKRLLEQIRLPIQPIPSRRRAPSLTGTHLDRRRTLRAAIRQGGDLHRLYHQKPRPRWPNLVVLCDISGSMSQYSRIILHFLHTVSNRKGQGWARVHAFTFGTRLTNITRHLHQRDVDAALAAAGQEAQDWEGGTRIAACLHDFNRDWSRRVLGQGAVVLLITDGLDRDDPAQLAREMQRLQLSARRLIWLNPLLRWDGFAPRALGIKAMLPHVDSFRAGHSVASLEELAQVLSHPEDVGLRDQMLRQMRS